MSMTQRWDEEAEFNVDLCITATVRCVGYSDPGRCSGPPENCYPPEGENEGTLKCVMIGDVRLYPDMTALAARDAVSAILVAADKEIDTAVQAWAPGEG